MNTNVRRHEARYHALPFPLDQHLASIITRYRNAAHLTQLAASRRSGIGEKTISSIENGRRADRITFAILYTLLRLYKVSIETFARDLRNAAREWAA